MKWCYITFRSITPAQRGEAALRQAGIRAELRRTPAGIAEKGCGYCLVVRPERGAQAAEVLRTSGVAFRKLYLVDGQGRGEELVL